MKYNQEAIERRANILKSLGFDTTNLKYLEYNASIKNGEFSMHFDFSVIDETKFVAYAIHQAYLRGLHNGRIQMKKQAREFLGLPSKDQDGYDILEEHDHKLARRCETGY
jgi:hypothetical protein